jgi:hypothetical protein
MKEILTKLEELGGESMSEGDVSFAEEDSNE